MKNTNNKIALLNKIDTLGTDVLVSHGFDISAEATDAAGIMVRSADMHSMQFGKDLLAIARAGAGVNNIPIDRCSDEGIVVFNTPGANANGVKELTIAALLLSSRRIVDGINWAATLAGQPDAAKQVEKGKSQFVGPELYGKTLGVIGLGAIGGMVANTATKLGMNVIGCDPYMTVKAAWSISRSVVKADTYDDIYAASDYITLHVPSTDSTRGMINSETIAKMKDGVRLINMARADLVVAADLKQALEDGKIASYVTDFPTAELLGVKGVIAIPHLGASTPESEENCAFMAANELVDYLEKGIIVNSVNYPSITEPPTAKHRMTVLHANIPSMLAQISQLFSSCGINIETLISQAKGTNAVSVFDTAETPTDDIIAAVSRIDGVRRILIID